jgi:hypothetical protein
MAPPPTTLEAKRMEENWEKSRAKVALQNLVRLELDKDDNGKNIRANVVYKMNKKEFSDFTQKFFTKQLQNYENPRQISQRRSQISKK